MDDLAITGISNMNSYDSIAMFIFMGVIITLNPRQLVTGMNI